MVARSLPISWFARTRQASRCLRIMKNRAQEKSVPRDVFLIVDSGAGAAHRVGQGHRLAVAIDPDQHGIAIGIKQLGLHCGKNAMAERDALATDAFSK